MKDRDIFKYSDYSDYANFSKTLIKTDTTEIGL